MSGFEAYGVVGPTDSSSGSITGVGVAVAAPSGAFSSYIVMLSGTWVGSIQIQASLDNATWSSISALNSNAGGAVQTVTSNGTYYTAGGGYPFLRVVSTLWTSGSASVTITGMISTGAVRPVQLDATSLVASAVQSGTWNITNISGTVSLPTGASTSANQSTEITSLQLIDDLPHAQNAALSKGVPIMGQLDDTSTTAATEDNVSVARITAQRALHTNLRNNAGTEIGTSANPVRIDPTGTTTQPVSATITAVSSGITASFSKKVRVDVFSTPITLTSSVTYNTLVSYSGSGLLIGFSVEFNSINVVVKLVVDGDTIFDGVSISTMNGFVVTAATNDKRQNGQGLVTASSNLDWSLKYPMAYATNYTISARIDSGILTHTFNQGIVYSTKET